MFVNTIVKGCNTEHSVIGYYLFFAKTDSGKHRPDQCSMFKTLSCANCLIIYRDVNVVVQFTGVKGLPPVMKT